MMPETRLVVEDMKRSGYIQTYWGGRVKMNLLIVVFCFVVVVWFFGSNGV
jgi:hypothetical protein